MNYAHELAVLIGRFQPPHQGHLSVIKKALDHAPMLAVLVGSAFAPRSHRNPFSFDERADLIRESVCEAGLDASRVYILPLEDAAYNDEKWMTSVRNAIGDAMVVRHGRRTGKVSLIGHSKDHTSFYLHMFPEFDSINVPCFQHISATPMRNIYFSNTGHMWLTNCDGHRDGDLPQDRLVPTAVRQFLDTFIQTPDYKAILAEYEFVLAFRAPYLSLPFPPIFVTADACVIQSGHILLVQRGRHPGKGQWALPGGHVEQHQTIENAMLDELSQETLIGLDREIIRSSIIHQGVYDDPNRDPRGRYLTHAFLVHLKRSRNLPNVKGNDDAVAAKWWALPDVKREVMAFDHYDIIQHLTARI